jgi:cell wall-associated NlpC family hydrolase
LPHRPARPIAFLAVVALSGGLLVSTGAAMAAPPNPSDSQLSAAARAKASLADEVGRLSAQVVQMQTTLNRLSAQKELAEQKVALALQQLQQAKDAAAAAKARVEQAQHDVSNARAAFDAYMQAVYMGGSMNGTTGALLTAQDPSALLAQSTVETYQSTHQLSAIGDLQRATVGKSNADAAARAAVQRQAAATQAAQDAKDAAVAAVLAAQREQEQLQSTLAANQTRLHDAQLRLATLNNERQTFLNYQAEQRRIAAERARQARLAAERAAALALQQQQQQNNNNGGGGGGGGGGTYVPPGPVGSWTSHAGQVAVARAERWLGTPYSWAGGNAQGPTYGVCAGDGAFNDCNIVGFDCSGLVMYAWAQFPFAHYAATQYTQGSVHPDTGSLMPGDLVFWSADGTIGGIHHVAIYIGGGNVIQAPESGSVIKITPLSQVDWGYFGATRPLT